MSWTLDDLESWAKHEERLARGEAIPALREAHVRAASVYRARADDMRSHFRASLGLARR
ncbi:hypothetical protein [Sphingomonas lenta]|uniref:hypothetical protein n=1 Tax=Sphingomonas lenta TaxID=1141887 RepID=UPI001595B3BC|nr:hypothetical protein [Sphingomonas lenta]